jgi:phosphonopyruvate decarboxylase
MNPPNLTILCIDNGHYGETGWQKSHTGLGVDLERIAAGCGIARSLTVARPEDIVRGARLLREGNGSAFVLLRVKPTEPPPFRRNFDASLLRDRFRAALLGT